ncbi:MAG: hypothetical protein GY862_02625 [Gammaproteobacteria bacterium]|nr:hypothetical protein [Gammaproteobacteria bacterium]
MRTDYLYKDFLHNKKIYNLNEGFWTQTITQMVQHACTTDTASQGFQKWLKTSFSNNEKCYDANPIFNALCETQNKAIRIIQEEPEVDNIEISAWIDHSVVGHRKISELVISLELSKKASNIAEDLIKYWILETTDNVEMNKLIDEKLRKLH